MSSPSFRVSQPGLIEIIAGSVLSLLAGVVLAFLFLIFRPVPVVEQAPKDAKAGTVLFIQGRKDWNSGRRWLFKRDSFLQGHSVSVTEDELNAWIEAIYPPLPPAPPPSAKDKKEVEVPWLLQGTPNVRLVADGLSVAYICDVNLLGLSAKVVVQSEGRFTKTKSAIEFQPKTLFVGSMPVHRFFLVKGFAFRRLVGIYQFPEDLEKAWAKLSDVKVDRSQLVLTVGGT